MIKEPSSEVIAAVRLIDAYLVEQLIAIAQAPPEQTPSFVLNGAAMLLSSLRETFFVRGGAVLLPAEPAMTPEELQKLLDDDKNRSGL